VTPSNRTYRKTLCNLVTQGFIVGMLWSGVFSLSLAHAEPLKITISGASTSNINNIYYYYTQLLTLALEKTRATDGDFVISYLDHGGGIERDRAMLMAGFGIDVMWASVTKERQKKLHVVDFDLLKGLNNYRALLIHKSSQVEFDKIQTLDELKVFKVGSGTYWTNGLIMESNGFKVIYGTNYAGLFKMLAVNRFDFLSRGLHEIGSDLIGYRDLGLVQERNLLLQYDTPIRYSFFVNKNNKALADRLERGLKAAQADGSFDELFLQIPMFKYGNQILQSDQRIIFKINNNTGD
jgi:hypothetical protein